MRRVVLAVALMLAGLVAGWFAPSAPVAAIPPLMSWQDVSIAQPLSNPLSGPTTIVALPDGRAVILEKAGGVRIHTPLGGLLATDALRLNVCTGSEMGLLGAAADPAFLSNGYLYLYYTAGRDCTSPTGRANRLSRFRMTGNVVDPSSEMVLLSNISAYGGNHNGGGLEFGSDGMLYVAIGDAGSNPRGSHGGGAANSAAQDLSLLSGKIVRITPSGGVPGDNPLVGRSNAASCANSGINAATNQVCTEIYSWGLRNPYRIAFDPNDGSRLFANDVGQNAWEEVDQIVAGGNYGWNAREGACPTGVTTACPPPPSGVIDPLTSYAHNNGCEYITAGAFVPNGLWTTEYDGAYLFADGGCGKVWVRDAAGAVNYAIPLATTSGGIVDMEFVMRLGGNGTPTLMYVTFGSNEVRSLSPVLPAQNPSAPTRYTPSASPRRAYDTRSLAGERINPLHGGTTRLIDLGVPAGTTAAAINLTLVGADGAGYASVYTPRVAVHGASTINVEAGETVANAAIVPVDERGRIRVFSTVTADVLIDVVGTFAASGTSGYEPLSPQRLLDTRLASAAPDNEYSEVPDGALSKLITIDVGGRAGVPDDAVAVAMIVTGLTSAGGDGHVRVWPGGVRPEVSMLNLRGAGDIRANLVITPLGVDGSMKVFLHNVDDVLVDVAGYFTTSAASASYVAIAPSRQADSRVGQVWTTFAALSTKALNPSAVVPETALAVAANITATRTAGGGHIRAYPADEARPEASSLNLTGPGQTRAALALSKVGGGGSGSVAYFSAGGTDLIVDISGYFQR